MFKTVAPTYICGENGLGKSRHFDAFCWLLFGKDSKDRKDYNLRTYDAGHNELHHCECSVEAVISVDGYDYTLKREYKEQWVKPRGEIEEVFKGNTTECTWDGVPIRVSEYQKRVKEVIIEDSLFKMITNPRYFAEQMKWQDQRQVLLDMAGTKSDAEIAAGRDDFKALLAELNGKALADFRKELAAEKKRLEAEASEIQPRIDQTQKMMPAVEDWAALKREKARVKANLTALDMQIGDAGQRMDARHKAQEALRKEIYVLRAEQSSIVRRKQEEAEAECEKQNAGRRSLESNLKHWHEELTEVSIDAKRNGSRIEDLKKELEGINSQLDDLRKDWYQLNASVYDEASDVCPYCGQRLSEEKIAEARQRFEVAKKQALAANTEKGKAMAAQKVSLQKELKEKEEKGETLKHTLVSVNAAIKKYSEALLDTPTAKVEAVRPEEIEEWKEKEKEISELTTKLKDFEDDDDAALQKERQRQTRNMLQMKMDELNAVLQQQEQIAKAEEEIERLRQRGKVLAQMIADVEKRGYVANQFAKEKIADCEARINRMFEHVRFKLFNYTQDGNEYETCVELIDGVPYGVANTARQLNAGLDVINSLCRYNNVSAPIFIDGAESVNSYLETQAQMIFLKVTGDKELKVF